MNKKDKALIGDVASHMSNIASSIACNKKGHPKYQEIPEHLIKSMKAVLAMWQELHYGMPVPK